MWDGNVQTTGDGDENKMIMVGRTNLKVIVDEIRHGSRCEGESGIDEGKSG